MSLKQIFMILAVMIVVLVVAGYVVALIGG